MEIIIKTSKLGDNSLVPKEVASEAIRGQIADMTCPDHLQHPTTSVDGNGDIVIDACCDKIAQELKNRFGAQ